MTFTEQYRELGEIFRELEVVRDRNLKLAETHGKWVPGCLLFAEGLLVLLGLERFHLYRSWPARDLDGLGSVGLAQNLAAL
jgi:hypothetical protein